MRDLTLITVLAILLAAPAAASFSVSDDIPSLSVLFQQEGQIYSVAVKNTGNTTENIRISSEGGLKKVARINKEFTVNPGGTEKSIINIQPFNSTEPGLYVGSLKVSGNSEERSIPMGVRIVDRESSELNIDVHITADKIRPSKNITAVTVVSSNKQPEVNGTLLYEIRKSSTGEIEYNTTRQIQFKGIKSLKANIDPGRDLSIGDYYIQAHLADNDNERRFTSTDTFTIFNSFWTPFKIRLGLLAVAGSMIIGGGIYTRRWYEKRKKEESRYVFPVDYSKLPDGNDLFEVGKVAETQKTAYIDPKDLTTHAIVAGSTGSGKSVTANIIAEEALEQDIPVVVFDPTAQWTGFVKELKDDNLLEHYERFDMDTDTDPHPYRGIIKEIESEDPDIDFQELKKEGEITVFTLDQLTTEQFDQAVRKIIDQIFEIEWEESSTLEMFIIFDEVHRLLEEYGGEGGYKSLEKGAREFRKWGIGLMMCSQVTADFKQAISGNIMTEVQMQTKSMEDIGRVETKYGEQFAKRISSEDVGVGMIQNSNYNDGEPWFVDFRPTYHNPHKIPDEELKKYHKLSEQLDKLRNKLDQMEEDGRDVKDKRLEFQLADNKLKEGRFKMAKMYIDSLKDEVGNNNQ